MDAPSAQPRSGLSPTVILKGVAIAVAIVLLLHVTRMVLSGQGNVYAPDAVAYFDAANALRDGGDIYAPNKVMHKAKAGEALTAEEIEIGRSNTFLYIYPPAFASIFAPLTFLDLDAAFWVWWLLHFAMLAWLAFALVKLCHLKGAPQITDLLVILTVGLYGALSAEFRWGQVNLLVFALVAHGLLFIEEDKPIPGGLLLALAAHVKVLPFALIVLLLLQKRNRAALWMLVGCALFVLLPVPWLIGTRGAGALGAAVEMHIDYVRTVVLPALTSGRTSGIPQFYTGNNSLHAVLQRLFGEGTILYATKGRLDTVGPLLFTLPRGVISALGWTGALGMFAGSLWLGFKWRDDRYGRIAAAGLVLIALQFANVLFWEHHVVSLILPLAAVLGAGERRKALWLALPIAVVLSLPAAVNDALVLRDADALTDVVLFPRLWGLPTLAILAVCAVTVWLLNKKRQSEHEGAK
ncbi:MAG: DUF2029 domain-containing protein [Planctomycetes bacterium]|nr:DUF2029 domain-containing protein [Planctomycetota bacterium]